MSGLVCDMKKLRIIPRSWQPAAKVIQSSPQKPELTPPTPGLQSTPRARGGVEREGTPVRPVRGEKMERLRECLHAIEKTPVKRIEKGKRFSHTGPSECPVLIEQN